MANSARILSQDELDRVIQSVQKHTRFPQRNELLILLSHKTGMRVGEIARLTVGHVRERGGIVEQIRLGPDVTKGRHSRTVFIGTQLRERLAEYVQDDWEDDRPLFVSQRGAFSVNSLTQLFMSLYKKAGINGASSHSGRRRFITELHNQHVPMKVIQRLVGHRHLTTTQAYIDATDEQMRQAVELV